VCGATPVLRAIPRRAIRPSAAEIARNPRSSSARMRVAVKVGE
jgi:16S rRNA C1402 N4-methylase RsmH